jgi:hypothetical protein
MGDRRRMPYRGCQVAFPSPTAWSDSGYHRALLFSIWFWRSWLAYCSLPLICRIALSRSVHVWRIVWVRLDLHGGGSCKHGISILYHGLHDDWLCELSADGRVVIGKERTRVLVMFVYFTHRSNRLRYFFFCLCGIKTIDMVGYHWSNLSKLIDFNAFKRYQHKGWDKVADG